MSLFCFVLCLVVFYVIWRSENVIIPKFSPWKTVKNFTAEDRSSPNFTYNLKILLSFLQIATSLMSFVTIPWPTYFQTFVNYFEFVNLSFIPWSSVECVTTLSFYDKLVLIAAVPVVALILVAAVPFIILSIQNRLDMEGRKLTQAGISLPAVLCCCPAALAYSHTHCIVCVLRRFHRPPRST